MPWTRIKDTKPKNAAEDFMIWGEGWRYPAIASFDPETGEFFDPDTCSTLVDPTHWMALPDPPERVTRG
jgi:hypothetical protein